MKRLSAKLLALGLVVCSVSGNAYAAAPTPVVIVREAGTGEIAQEAASTNVASGKAVTASRAASGDRPLSRAVDGNKNQNQYTDPGGNTGGPSWIQVDLGKNYDLDKIGLWRYWNTGNRK
ncbi:MAG: discoidin domain-containing protein [Kineothrix sp.]